MNDPIWGNLPAVKNGNVYLVDYKWAFFDPLTMEWLLEEIPSALEKQ